MSKEIRGGESMSTLLELRRQMEIDYLKTKTYEEINDMFNQMNDKLKLAESVSKKFCKDEVIKRFQSDKFIDNVCLSYRHDFGLMSEEDKKMLRFECKEWMRAIVNNWNYFKE